MPDELTTVGRVLNLPPIPEIPEPVRGKSFAVVEAFHLGDPTVADEMLAPLRAFGPVNDTIASIPMPALSHVHMDPEQPVPGMGDGPTLESLPREALDELLAVAGPGSQFPLLSVEVRHLGGELRRAHPDGGALDAIDAGYVMFAVGMFPVPELAAPTEAQIRAVKGALTPWASRQMYFNFADSPAADGDVLGRGRVRPAAASQGGRRPGRDDLVQPTGPAGSLSDDSGEDAQVI